MQEGPQETLIDFFGAEKARPGLGHGGLFLITTVAFYNSWSNIEDEYDGRHFPKPFNRTPQIMTPPRHSRGSSNSLSVPILMAVIATLYLAREILIPLAFAVTLTFILAPAVTWLMKLRFKRAPAALVVVVLTIVTTGAVGYVIFNQLIQVLDELPVYKENIHNKIEAIQSPAKGALGRATENVKDLSNELSTPQKPTTAPQNNDI